MHNEYDQPSEGSHGAHYEGSPDHGHDGYDEHQLEAFLALKKLFGSLGAFRACRLDEWTQSLVYAVYVLLEHIQQSEYPDLRQCEGCDSIATHTDSEGIDLCEGCWNTCKEEAEGIELTETANGDNLLPLEDSPTGAGGGA